MQGTIREGNHNCSLYFKDKDDIGMKNNTNLFFLIYYPNNGMPIISFHYNISKQMKQFHYISSISINPNIILEKAIEMKITIYYILCLLSK